MQVFLQQSVQQVRQIKATLSLWWKRGRGTDSNKAVLAFSMQCSVGRKGLCRAFSAFYAVDQYDLGLLKNKWISLIFRVWSLFLDCVVKGGLCEGELPRIQERKRRCNIFSPSCFKFSDVLKCSSSCRFVKVNLGIKYRQCTSGSFYCWSRNTKNKKMFCNRKTLVLFLYFLYW